LEKRKLILLISGILIIIIFGAVLFYVISPSEYTAVYNKQYNKCTEQNQKKYALLMARKTGDISYCDKIKEIKDLCIAYATRDAVAYCADIEPEYEKERQRCNAEALGDASKCPETDFWCMAKASGDTTHCQKLDPEDVLECQRSLPQNAEYWASAEAKERCKQLGTSASEARLELNV